MKEIIKNTMINIENYLNLSKNKHNYYAKIQDGSIGYITRINALDRTFFISYLIHEEGERFIVEVHCGIHANKYYRTRVNEYLSEKGVARRAYIDSNGALIFFVDTYITSPIPMNIIDTIERGLISLFVLHGKDIERIACGLDPIEDEECTISSILKDIIDSEPRSDKNDNTIQCSDSNASPKDVSLPVPINKENDGGKEDDDDDDLLNDLDEIRKMLSIFKREQECLGGD